MGVAGVNDPGRVFICYRREESAYPAGWLYERLAERYGAREVFKDIDSIKLGDDYVDVIGRAVASCDVLLVLIGKDWLTAVDPSGHRRIDEPADFVRLEIEAAMSRNVRVIPILVNGAAMPQQEQLPVPIARLARRQALELSPSRFDADTERLLSVLDETIREIHTAQFRAVTESEPRGAAQHRPDAVGNGPRPGRPVLVALLVGIALLLVVGGVLIIGLMLSRNADPNGVPGGPGSPEGQDTGPLNVEESVSVSRGTGPSGTSISLSGLGFDDQETIDIRFHTTRIATARTDDSGNFTGVAAVIPGDFDVFAPKTFDIIASGRSSAKSASVPFRLTR